MAQTKTWVHPITKEEEIVEVGSIREQELQEKLHEAGFWDADDPNKPEGCMSAEEGNIR